MVRHLSHSKWVQQQYEEKYLRSGYRNVLVHSSIIEGTLRNESRRNKFDLANKQLLRSGKINSSEFCIFNKIRTIRNSLVHDSFRDGLVQDEIDELRDELMKRIIEAYKISSFLNVTLFKKYRIVRPSCIAFDLVK